jgi:hypothetical protein
MSILRALFDSEFMMRREIEELRETQLQMALATPSGPSERWVREISNEVKELAMTVRVMMRHLAEAGQLDVAQIESEVAEALAPRPKAKPAPKPPRPPEPPVPVTCVKCKTDGVSTDFVKIGADWMCRPCARNP